ncbi:MAG: bifunctional UDP-N-acetylglucosamine diphosphorylase/glucosamine-1-phosphate N-acetyltransferase GlmU [Micromonosporaceae bacterium]|nr:bifunctional UDP-N-acetylglucosamine diphosphorylase/glucosamine-1-phosphate N-acetyltransferase GlmU [Micromonosporaceae bacterium]
MSRERPRTVVILAAGEGKRMRSALPKVLHPLLGRTLLGHVLAAAEPLAADRTLVVVGVGAEQVIAHLAEVAPKATPVVQAEQLGTGHAVRVALAAAPDPVEGTVVVLNGDLPLLRSETVRGLVEAHEAGGAAATLVTVEPADPTGLGRIIRDPADQLAAVVEERDATAQQRAVREVNAGIYAFQAGPLRAALDRIGRDNAQGEEYLTDVPGGLVAAGHPVAVHRLPDPTDALGCNDRAELAAARARLRDRVNLGWLRAGVSIVDPATTWIDVTATLGPDTVVEPNTHLRGATTVGAAATVGPDVSLIDTTVGDGASVVRAHAVRSQIGPGAQVGPYASLRPASRLAAGAKVGTFVETKNSEIGEGAKVPHQAYVGDASIGAAANVGAGTIVVNYDGLAKHPTEVGEAAFVGSNSNLVAPVTVGAGAYVAAGSTVTTDVPPGALGVARGRQRNLDGWVRRRRAGTKSAEAAARAGEPGAGEATDRPDQA